MAEKIVDEPWVPAMLKKGFGIKKTYFSLNDISLITSDGL